MVHSSDTSATNSKYEIEKNNIEMLGCIIRLTCNGGNEVVCIFHI